MEPPQKSCLDVISLRRGPSLPSRVAALEVASSKAHAAINVDQ
jgi:hypothetical protein